MNPHLILSLVSFKQELTYVAMAFILVISLPFIAIIALTHTGVQVVSDQLATVSTQTLEIKNPLNGTVSKTISGPFIWPVPGRVTLQFGDSDLPYQPFHTGIDIAGKEGDPIHAFFKGTVISTDEIGWGYGTHVIIDHGDNLSSLYAHLQTISASKGQEVSAGQIIGTRGSSGWSTGPHLHFEIRVYGIPINPETLFSTPSK
ncbi:MAG: M23 family metallopeptidase [Candidatus Woesebacteria bacterium]